jgi:hypothetical protein
MTPKRILALFVFIALAMAVPMFAQSDRATIVGTVKDSSSAVMPGVQVRVTNVATNAVETASTDSTGFYRVVNLAIGDYVVSFSKNGFKTLERKGLTLLISQVAEVDATLQVGGMSESVEVTSAPPILQTEDSTLSANLNNEAVSELPLNVQGSRNLSNFMFAYLPGVEGSDYGSHINGGMAMTKEVLIDGTSAVSQLGGYISESQPPMEAVQEFEADTSGISADAGRSGGGVFKYELKSGANKIHGSAFGFMHSANLDAESSWNRLAAILLPANKKADLTLNETLSDWGGGFGGAIVKDKLFYFGSFERYMQSMWNLGAPNRVVPTDGSIVGGVTTADMLGVTGTGFADLSPMLTTSNVVGTAQPVTNAGVCNTAVAPVNVYQGSIYMPGTGCVFANNQIPTSLISKTSAKIAQLYHQYYAPETSLPVNNAGPAYQPDPWFHNTQSGIKMDYNQSAKQHIAGSFYWDDYPRINADQGGAWSATAKYGGPMANSYWHNTTAPSARLSDAITITPNLLNTVYATFNRFRNPSIATSQAGKWDSDLGLASGVTDAAGNFPLIYFESGEYTNGANYQNGWNFSNVGSQYNDFYAGNTFIYSDQLVWSHKRHNVKAGVEFRAMQFNYHTDNGTFMGGYPIIFDPSTTAGIGWQTTGNAFASFLLGDVYNAESNNPDNEYGRRKAFSAYVSDDIKVNSRLTVNVSLRWDFNNPYKEKYGHWSSFELDDKNPISGLMGTYEYLKNGSQSFERRQDYYNYAPHIGVAYKLDEKTVARGNGGVFFSPLNMNTWGGVPYQQAGDVGFHNITQEANFNWDGGYNPTLVTPTTPGAQSPTYITSDVISIDPRSLTPGNTWQYNFGVQRELDKVTKVDVNWIQSWSTHLHSGFFQHDQPKIADYQNFLATGAVPQSMATICATWGSCGDQYPLVALVPYPQVYAGYTGPLLSVGTPLGNSDYKSLQVSVVRRAAKGLSLQASYNWSRTHGDVDSDFEEPWWTGPLQNTYDLKTEAKDIADFDVTHIVKGYVIYDLPFGRGKMLMSDVSTLVDEVVGGWTLDGDFHYSTGTPISVHSTNNYPGFNSIYVDLVPGCKLTNGSRKLGQIWLNRACFANPAAGQLGTAGNYQEQVRNPGTATEDLALHKTLSVGADKRYNLTLRIEFFNVFNRDALAGPDTGLNDTNLKGENIFGLVSNYGGVGGRQGQFGARFTF